MSPARSRPRRLARGLVALAVLAGLLLGLPVLLAGLSTRLLDSPNPLSGVSAPWTWTRTGIVDALTSAADQDRIIDTLARSGLVVAWLALAVLAVTVVVELVAQGRHGEPLPRMRGLSPFQTLAQPLVAALLSLSTMMPTHLAAAAELPARVPVATQPAATPTGAPRAHAPAAASDDGWRPYSVVKGDSIYGIAGRLAGGDPARTRELARRILDRNLGRTMPGGHRFTTPGYIETGWRLDLPDISPPAVDPQEAPPPAQPAETPDEVYVVRRGDCYWEIAEEHLRELEGHQPSERQVLDHTRQLVAYNAPLLGNPTPAHLIHPGEVVQLVAPANGKPRNGSSRAPAIPPPAPDPAPVVAPVEAPAVPPATDAVPPVVPGSGPAPEAPAVTTPSTDPPPTAPTPVTSVPAAPTVTADSHERTNPWVGLGLTSVFATGVTVAIVRLRRRRLARRRPGTRLATSSDRARTAAIAVHAAAQPHRIALLRQLLGSLAGHYRPRPADALIRAAQLDADHIELLWTHPQIHPPAGWVTTDGGWSWRHPWPDLADGSIDPVCVAPALVAVGHRDDAELLIDLETAGSLAVTGHSATAEGLVRQLTLTLASSPLGGLRDVILIGYDGPATRHLEQARTASLSDTIRWVAARRDDQRQALHDAGTATATGARLLGRRNDPWDALVAVVDLQGLTADEQPRVDELLELCTQGSGFAALLLGDHSRATDHITCTGPDNATWNSTGVTFRPATLPAAAASDLDDLLDDLAIAPDEPCQASVLEPVEAVAVLQDLHADVDVSASGEPDEPSSASLRPYDVLVRVLGEVRVEGVSVRLTEAETELLALLATFRADGSVNLDRLTTLLARDDWSTPKTKTIQTRISMLRTKLGLGSDGRPLVPDARPGPNSPSRYTVSERVLTEVDLIDAAYAHADDLPSTEASALLRDALELIRGRPYTAKTGYTWAFDEYATQRAEQAVADVATRFIQLAAEAQDVSSAIWAANQASRVILDEAAQLVYQTELARLAATFGDDELSDSVLDFQQRLDRAVDSSDPFDEAVV